VTGAYDVQGAALLKNLSAFNASNTFSGFVSVQLLRRYSLCHAACRPSGIDRSTSARNACTLILRKYHPAKD
jgi:hypothetical protein